MTNMNLVKLLVSILLLGGSIVSFGASIDWSGTYRFEYLELDKPALTSGSRKGYALNHLILAPKITAADGFTINSKFHILNNRDAMYANSQLGEIWGPGVGTGTPTTRADSTSVSENQPSSSIEVSELYLLVNQEFGSIVVGRAPVQFGLGITHNAGNGLFDHWYDTRDMVGYKVNIGNLFIMPSFSKVYDGKFKQGGDTSINTLHFEYNNQETGNQLGLFYETKSSTLSANDAPSATLGGTGINGRWLTTSYNFLLGKTFEGFDFKIEAGFQSGSTGVRTTGGNSVGVNGYGVVSEVTGKPSTAGDYWKLAFGSVSGDNPNTENYEGFLLDRNYDIAFMMFNHPMGQADVLKTSLARSGTASGSADDEVISNALFIAPKYVQKLNERWTMENTIAWAQLNNDDLRVGASVEKVGSDLGFEWDLGFTFRPNDNVTWKNQLGLYFPGSAYSAGSLNLDTDSVIGLQSSAAISF